MKKKTPYRHRHWFWLLAIAATFYYFTWIFNPLPSDEEMIENFKANRADFIEAVRRYREYPRVQGKDSSFWYKEGDTLELFKRAGIDSIDRSIGLWLPNPYSVETAIKAKQSMRQWPWPSLIISYKYSALRIRPATTPLIDHPDQTDHRRHYHNHLLFGTIWKDYHFFPEVPRIENGELLWPLQTVGRGFHDAQFHEKEGVATSQTRRRVFPSLNRLPKNWQDFECVYRQIEPQWFIRMCNGH